MNLTILSEKPICKEKERYCRIPAGILAGRTRRPFWQANKCSRTTLGIMLPLHSPWACDESPTKARSSEASQQTWREKAHRAGWGHFRGSLAHHRIVTWMSPEKTDVRPSHSRHHHQILRILTQKWSIFGVACCSSLWVVGKLVLVVRNLQTFLGMDTICVCKDAQSCSYRRASFYGSRCETFFQICRERLRTLHRKKKMICKKREAEICFSRICINLWH